MSVVNPSCGWFSLNIQVVKFNKKLHIKFPPTRSCSILPPLEMSSLASVMNNTFKYFKKIKQRDRWKKVSSIQVPVLPCPPPHPISHQASCHTGTSRTRRKSFLNCKLGVIWEFGGHCNVGPNISCWTNRLALSLAAHEGKKNTDDSQSTVLTSTLAVLVLTLKVCYDRKKLQPYQLPTALLKLQLLGWQWLLQSCCSTGNQ